MMGPLELFFVIPLFILGVGLPIVAFILLIMIYIKIKNIEHFLQEKE